jgi:F-type H+-transporting ATPase subunit epsilon
MRLKVIVPTEIRIDTEVTKIIAEAENGAFCLLPRHIDFVTTLAPGLLSFVLPAGDEEFLAVDEGTLVKCGTDVLVSSRQAVRAPDLGQLRQTVADTFRSLDEREAMARAILAKLEADTVRRFVKLGEAIL